MSPMVILTLLMTAVTLTTGHLSCSKARKIVDSMNLLLDVTHNRFKYHEETPLVAFSFHLSKSFTSKSSGDVIPFDKKITNTGGSFFNGVFKCPVTGMYYFSWTIFTNPNKLADTQLRVDGHIKRYCNNNNSGGKAYSSTGCSIILQLNKGDRVYITSHNTHGFFRGLWSHFQGWLMRASSK